MKNKSQILIIGYFGYKTDQLDGQTIKTRNIYKLLVDNYASVEFCDTQAGVRACFVMLYKLIHCNCAVVLPGQRALLTIFPIVFVLSKICNYKIIYCVVGGWLDVFLRKRKWLVRMLSSIQSILVESEALKTNLIREFSLDNVSYFPNFRPNCSLPCNELTNKFKIVFMARICEEKGIDAIFRFSQYVIDNKLIRSDFPLEISFYGNLDSLLDSASFFLNIDKYPFVKYYGIIAQDQVYEVLNNHDVLVLPTRYPGEGLPGSIIEAYIVGIPVIVSKWRFLPEYVKEGKTGYCYDLSDEHQFYNYILKLYNDSDLLCKMKECAKREGRLYTADFAWNKLNNIINYAE